MHKHKQFLIGILGVAFLAVLSGGVIAARAADVACPMSLWVGNVDGSFSQFNYHVSAIDASAKTVRVTDDSGCSGYTLSNNNVLALDANDQVIKDILTMQVGDHVTVYAKSYAAAYAVKDYTLSGLPRSGPILPTPKPIPVACTADAMLCPDGSWIGRSGPSCKFVCPITTIGSPSGSAGGNATIQAGLSLGIRSSAVLALQQELQAAGYLSASSATGYFGSLTLAAVKQYQTAHSLPSTGYVGSLTAGAMNVQTQ